MVATNGILSWARPVLPKISSRTRDDGWWVCKITHCPNGRVPRFKKRLADWDHGQTIPSDLVYVSFEHCHTHGDLARAPIAKRLCHDSFRRETQNLRQEGEQYANIKPNIRDFSSTYDISR